MAFNTRGAAAGAASGAVAGGWWGAAIGGLMGGFMGGGGQGDIDKKYAQYNAQMQLAAGRSNAAAGMAMAGFNMQMGMEAASLSSNSTMLIAGYNAHLKSLLGDMNAKLYEDDARTVWEKAGLDTYQLNQVFAKQKGNMQTAYGASGVIMNQDSPLDSVVDASSKHEMDLLVVKRGADIQAGKLLDAAARSRWQGNVEAQQMVFEGQMRSTETMGNAMLRGLGEFGQARINAAAGMYNAGIAADKTYYGGMNASLLSDMKDNQDMYNSVFGAAMKGSTQFNNASSSGGGGSDNWGGAYSSFSSDMATNMYF